jgi:hypothetical protein
MPDYIDGLPLPRDDGHRHYPPPDKNPQFHRYVYIVEIQSQEKDCSKIDEALAMRIDHEFRGRFQLARAQIDNLGYYIKVREVAFDPVLADHEPPPDYTPHPMPVVDHRKG